MGCSNCGNSSPCSCSQQVRSSGGRSCVTCGCGNLGCPGCGCGTALPATPAPYYTCAPACPENHKQTIVTQNFYYDIQAQNTWNVPDCGETAVLYVSGIKSIAIGAYIWSAEFGYFEVTAFDASSQQVTVQNNCNDGNASPGTNVPACSKFTVTDPPFDNSGLGASCVALDFTAPAVGVCIPITLTNLDSIQASDLIQIGAGRYRVQSIDSSTVITICNDGLGLVAGTSVIARDAAGNYQYCITVVSTCCERIEDEFGGDLTPCSNFENVSVAVEDTSTLIPGPVTILGGETADSNNALIEIENTSECRVMNGMINVVFHVTLDPQGTTGLNTLSVAILESVDGEPATNAWTSEEQWVDDAADGFSLIRVFSYSRPITIAAGDSHTYNYIGHLAIAASGNGSYIITEMQIRAVGFGVAV